MWNNLGCKFRWNSSATLSEKLKSLGSGDEDRRVLDYPLYRPYIHFGMDLFTDDIDGYYEVLRRQLARQNIVRETLGLKAIDVEKVGNGDLFRVLSQSMSNVGYGSLESQMTSSLSDEHREFIKKLPKEQRICFVDYVSQCNALIGESNEIIAAALGCNFNAQPIVSTEAAINVIFYLCEYMLKDGMEVAALLGVVDAAKRRCDNFPGCAPEGEDPKAGSRPIRRFVSVVLNGICGLTEMSPQQCALNVAGLPAHFCSHAFSWVFPSPAIQQFRLFSQPNAKDEVDISVSKKLAPPNRVVACKEQKSKRAQRHDIASETTAGRKFLFCLKYIYI